MAQQLGRRILVADDERAVRGVLTQLLEGAGYVVHQAAGGVEALAEMQRLRFDAVLIDRTLPGIGLQVFLGLCRRTRPYEPVLVLSADLAELPDRLRSQGAAALIPKPIDFERLLRTLTRAMPPLPEDLPTAV